MKTRKLSDFIHFFAVMAALIVLSACVKNTELVGYTFKSEKLDQIKAGQTSQDYVRNTLGSPSVIGAFGDNTWYYISTEYESVAFFKPKVKQQKIIAISFDDGAMVAKVKEYSASDAREVALIKDITKTQGRDVGVVGELLGNVGRFNSEPGKPKIKKPKSVPN